MEVHRAVLPLPLPGAPDAVEGAIDLHGRIVAVLDLAIRLGAGGRPVVPDDHLVVVEALGRELALRVERVEDLIEIGLGDIAPNRLDDRYAADELVAGVARGPGGMVVVLDLDRFLDADEAAVLDRVTALSRAGGDRD